MDISQERIGFDRHAVFRGRSAWRGGERGSTFALESDAVVEPSLFIDDVPGFGLTESRAANQARVRYERSATPLATDQRGPPPVPAAPERDNSR